MQNAFFTLVSVDPSARSLTLGLVRKTQLDFNRKAKVYRSNPLAIKVHPSITLFVRGRERRIRGTQRKAAEPSLAMWQQEGGDAGFGPCFHLSGFHLGYRFSEPQPCGKSPGSGGQSKRPLGSSGKAHLWLLAPTWVFGVTFIRDPCTIHLPCQWRVPFILVEKATCFKWAKCIF